MPKRRDNMLEAFRESSRLDKEPEPPRPRAGESLPFPDAGAKSPTPAKPGEAASDAARANQPPVEPAAPDGEPDLVGVASLPGRGASLPAARGESGARKAEGSDRAEGSGRTAITLPVGREWFFGIAVALLTGAFLLGRWSAGTIEAAGRDLPGGASDAALADLSAPGESRVPAPGPLRSSGPSEGTPRESTPAPRSAPELTAADQAFLDPANAYTVVAITYDDTENGRDRAIDTYRHLQAAEFDVVYPRRKGGKLLIFVGASPGYRDLESVESRLRRTAGPNGQMAFTGAYRVNIADYR